jgi:hypothetical protein
VSECDAQEPLLPGPAADLPASDSASTAARAFGEENRARLLDEYFEGVSQLDPTDAWKHVYRLLLWIDRTTGLVHCYESDKCQPGRPWYARSLAFHAWLAALTGVAADALGEHIDLLFRRATADLATAAAARRGQRDAAAAAQRAPYADLNLPRPGEDPELQKIIASALGPYLTVEPPQEVLRALTERIQAHIGQENKRKNLVGEGFEDTLAVLLRRTADVAETNQIFVRPWLHDLPGFHRPRGVEKARKVDLALVARSGTRHRTLVSCKWSVRSDREEQFASDFRSYIELEAAGEDFAYVLVTNEFDPARLVAACDARRQNGLLFTDVVHVNPDGLIAAYSSAAGRVRDAGGQARALQRIKSGRLASLSGWISTLA